MIKNLVYLGSLSKKLWFIVLSIVLFYIEFLLNILFSNLFNNNFLQSLFSFQGLLETSFHFLFIVFIVGKINKNLFLKIYFLMIN